jgi:hypothetical protein
MAGQSPVAGTDSPRKAGPAGGARAPGTSGKDLSAVRAGDISFDEQIEIIGEINEVVEHNRIEIRPDTFDFVPRKRGAVIPLLVNVLSLIAVALAGFLLFRVFTHQEQVLTGRIAAVVTAEGMIIEAVREESEAQLNAKDQEIASIQQRLRDLQQEREQLKLEMDVRVQAREEQLRAALTQELDAERRKLQEAGVSTATIQQQLSALEARLNEEREQNLTAFRTQTQAELEDREREITRLIEENNAILERSRRERVELERQLAAREAQLREEARAQTEAIETERTQIAGRLAELQRERERERVVLDQLLAQYNQVRGNLAAGRYNQALSGLEAIDRYLTQESVAAMPAIQRRLPIERFTIASLRELIRLQQSSTGQVQALSQADTMLASIQDTVAEADRQAAAGDSAAAIGLYQRAIDTIPEIQRSHATLVEAAAFGSLDQFQKETRESEEALRRLQEQLRQAQARINQQSREISGLQSAAGSRETLLQQLQDLRRRYGSLQVRAEESAAGSREQVLELLEVKLKVRQALATESVKSRSPNLYEALEDYLEAFGREQQLLGREAALGEATAAVDSLTRRGSRVDLEAIKAHYGGGSGDPFVQFLDRLEALLK